MCSPDTASIIIIVVMAISGCCGVCVWISLFVGCTYLLCKCYKSRKHKQPRQRRVGTRDYDNGVGYMMDNVRVPPRPPGPSWPPVPTAVLQPMTVLMPVYNQATLMTHPIQPVAGGNWIPSIDETNTTLYRNRSSRSLQQQPNPLYHDDSESHSTTSHTYGNGTSTHIHHHNSFSAGGHVISNHQELTSINDESDAEINSPPPDYNSLL